MIHNTMVFHIFRFNQLNKERKFRLLSLPNKRIQFLQQLLKTEEYKEAIRLLQSASTFYYVDKEMVTYLVNTSVNQPVGYKERLISYILSEIH